MWRGCQLCSGYQKKATSCTVLGFPGPRGMAKESRTIGVVFFFPMTLKTINYSVCGRVMITLLVERVFEVAEEEIGKGDGGGGGGEIQASWREM